jgi:hypothetical protein
MILKSSLFLLLTIFVSNVSFAQQDSKITIVADSTKKIEIAEVSCGECKFKMVGSGCDLAVRIDGKSYFVDGTKIDQHGDAHAKDGFCETIRKAEVQGVVVGDRYKVSYFKLLPIK